MEDCCLEGTTGANLSSRALSLSVPDLCSELRRMDKSLRDVENAVCLPAPNGPATSNNEPSMIGIVVKTILLVLAGPYAPYEAYPYAVFDDAGIGKTQTIPGTLGEILDVT
jgi:hypothetical protein